jgi:hypothetical protein
MAQAVLQPHLRYSPAKLFASAGHPAVPGTIRGMRKVYR